MESFPHPPVILNLYDFLLLLQNTKEASLRNVDNQTVLITIDFYSILKDRFFSKYVVLCSTEERESFRFGMTCGWVNDGELSLKAIEGPMQS